MRSKRTRAGKSANKVSDKVAGRRTERRSIVLLDRTEKRQGVGVLEADGGDIQLEARSLAARSHK